MPHTEAPVTREAKICITIGLVAALCLFFFFDKFSFLFYYMLVIVHEFGHVVFDWLFGYPSLPSFDFTYGGGYALNFGRNSVILLGAYVVFCFLYWKFLRGKGFLKAFLTTLVVYSICAFSPLHKVMILFMGHGMELVFSGIFFYRALTGYGVKILIERPLYAFLAFYIQLYDLGFAKRLLISDVARAKYEAAKGGGHIMDFSRIAEEYLHVDLKVVAFIFMLLCFLPPFLSMTFYLYKNRIKSYFLKPPEQV